MRAFATLLALAFLAACSAPVAPAERGPEASFSGYSVSSGKSGSDSTRTP